MSGDHHAARLADAVAAGSAVEGLRRIGHGGAADELEAGGSLPEILERHRVLPPAYTTAFRVGRPRLVRTLVGIAETLHTQQIEFIRAARAALAMLVAVLVALAVGGALALPALRAWMSAQGIAVDPAWTAAANGFGALATPVGIGVVVGVLMALWFGMGFLWARTPPGCRAHRAAAVATVGALVGAGASLEEGLRVSALGRPGWLRRRLDRGATALEAGGEPASVLGRARLVTHRLGALLTLAPGAGGSAARLLSAAGALQQAEVEVDRLVVGRGVRLITVALAGALAAGFAVTLLSAWLEILRWFG